MIFNCLDPDLDILGNHLLEASAGTGKTFAIEHITLRLLLEGIKIDEILLITFTKAATRELSHRIHTSLQSMVNLLEEKDFENLPPYLQNVAPDLALKVYKEALLRFDEAAIYTIHGFCYRMIERHSLLTGVDVSQRDPESEFPTAALHREILDVFRKDLPEEAFSPAQLGRVTKHFRGDFLRMSAEIVSLISSRASFPRLRDYSESLQALQEILRDVNPVEILNACAPYFKGMANRSGEIHQDLLDGATSLSEGVNPVTLDAWIRADRDFFPLITKENQKKKEPPSLPWKEIDEINKLFAEAKSPHNTLLRIAKKCAEHLRNVKKEQSLYLPDDYLEIMHAYCEKMQTNYKAVIVDEFQDTDRMQWEILEKTFYQKNQIKALYLVGDPKQSIYAFRNADLSTYFQASQILGESARGYLQTNYRSSPSVISSLNELFLQAGDWLGQSFPLEFHPSQINPQAKEPSFSDESGSVHFFLAQGEKTREKAYPPTHIEQQKFFPFVAKEILRLHEEGLSYSDFAVLIKDRFQADRLQIYLRSKGILSVTKGVMSLVDTEAFAFFETLFSCLSRRGDISAIKQVLSFPFVGNRSIHSLEEELEKLLEAFAAFETCIREKGFTAFWNAFLSATFSSRTVLEETLALGLEAYSDLEQVAELFMQREAEKPCHFEEYLMQIAKIKKEAKENPESFRRNVLTEKEMVTLMTSHMSKGLEFPIVFALGLASRHAGKNTFIKTSDQEIRLSDPNDPKCKAVLHLIEEEKMRLLYVALTRAKSRVYVPYYAEDPPREGELSPIEQFFFHAGVNNISEISSLLTTMQKNTSIRFETLTEPLLIPPTTSEKTSLEGIAPKEIKLHFPVTYTHSFSSISQSSSAPLQTKPPEETMPLGAKTGTVIHNLLDFIIKRALYHPWNAARIHELITSTLRSTFLEPHTAEVQHIIQKAFEIELSPGLSLMQIPPSQMLSEVEFLYDYDSETSFKGVADLLFVHEGVHYLLDWKTNYLEEGYGIEQLENAMRQHEYYLQGDLYAAALIRFLKAKGNISFGGMFYLFLRGIDAETKGVYHFHPEAIQKEVSIEK